ncbi:MAG: glycosyltransferase family 9 protein [Gammaproteobacteria bacterium]|nr:glycosyltransferase family 9 protein [Candidatus Competibacteraceae bacterium]MCP5195199.1 glycosyltransferase family 9 protein [Gammaproteobacteria bacterium]
MKIDLMRKVDYFVGIPLCFLVTRIFCFIRLFGRQKNIYPRKVLFIELSEMGSTILADPAMRKIRQKGDSELYFLIFKANVASLYLLNTVPKANIFVIREDRLLNLIMDTFRFLVWARCRGIDTVIDLELFSRYTALLTGLSGAVNRIGFHAFYNEGLYRGEMLTRRVAYNPHLHIAKNFMALVNTALAATEELPFSKTLIADSEIDLAKAEVSESALSAMNDRIRGEYPAYDEKCFRIVLINPNASDLLPQRRWMPDYFVAVMCGLLSDDENLLILITGSPAERDEAEGLKRQVGSERCVNFAGCLSLQELPVLYRIAEIMLTNDSGPGHFSAVTNLRTFVIFGPETPRLYGSLGNSMPIYAGLACSPCVSAANHRKTPCADNVCLRVIEPEMVLERLREALKENGSRDGIG